MVTNKEKNFISAVVYVHDNQNDIDYFMNKVYKVLSENFEKYEIICVNDFSSDKSSDVLKSSSEKLKDATVSIINMSYFQGVELSMNAGMDLAIGDFVIEFDSVIFDYSQDLIMEIYRHSLKGYDIVSAAPKNVKRISSKMFYHIFNKYSRSNYKIQTESFRILSRRAINRVHSMSITLPYRKAVYANCGLKIDQIEYTLEDKDRRLDNKKHIHRLRKDIALDALILFTNIGYRISLGMTLIMMMVAAFMAFYSLNIYFSHNTPVEGWTTTILFLSVSFFGIFAVSAIIIKYLSVIIDLIFKKQKYTFESIEKVTK